MIYLLFGEDSYRSSQKLLEVRKHYLNRTSGDGDFLVLDGSELTVDDFRRCVQTVPLLATSRCIVIRHLLRDGKKEVQDALVAHLTVPNSTVLFFYEQGTPDGRLKLFQALNKPTQVQRFDLLKGAELRKMTMTMASNRGLALSAELVSELNQRIGSDLWRLDNELIKLSLLASRQGQLKIEDLHRLVPDQSETSLFQLTEAFGRRQSRMAITTLGRLQDRENSFGLIALIASHYRQLLIILDGRQHGHSPAEIAKTTKLHPYVIQKGWEQTSRYQVAELLSCLRYLLQLDYLAKQSILEPHTGLLVMAASLQNLPLNLPDLTEETMLQ